MNENTYVNGTTVGYGNEGVLATPRGGFFACHPSRLMDGVRAAMGRGDELRVSDQIPPREVFWIDDDPLTMVNNTPINREQFGPVVDYKAPDFVLPEIEVKERTFACVLCKTIFLAVEFPEHLRTHSEEELASWDGGFFALKTILDEAEKYAASKGLL